MLLRSNQMARFKASTCCLKPVKTINFVNLIILSRKASTVAGDAETPIWPKATSPTPYEILGITQSQALDTKLLKRKYRELCKVYHPDISGARTFLNHRGEELNNKAKETRFKQINSAYNLLRDPQKKSMYDRFKSGWEFSSNLNVNYGASRANSASSPFYGGAHYNMHDDRFWNAGNWEDYAHMSGKDPRYSDPIFRSELARKNRDVLMLCVAVALFIMCAQILYALDKYYQGMMKVESDNHISNNHLFLAYINHGLGLDKWSRVNHFLWNRRYSMYSKDEKLLARQAADDDELVSILRDKEKEEEKQRVALTRIK